MTSMQHWTPEQWGVFTATIAAGLIAAAVLAVLRRGRWAPPAAHRVRGPGPRPSLVLTQARPTSAEVERFKVMWREIHANARQPMTVLDATWVDPMKVDYTDPGIGALTSILAVESDPALRTAAEVDAEEDAWINAYADLAPLMTETAAAVEAMRVALEPAMRTARLWRIRCEGGPARQALNDWRMDTPTCELPPLDKQYMTARALLVS
jgi:hypothetical protein